MTLQVQSNTQNYSTSYSSNTVVGTSEKRNRVSTLSATLDSVPSPTDEKQKIRQNLRNKIQAMLEIAKDLPPQQCVSMIRRNLADIQTYCAIFGKTFIVVEEDITCEQYDLEASPYDKALLFRGPDERATVAICVTEKGSLLHRNDSAWTVYRNAGDIFTHHFAA